MESRLRHLDCQIPLLAQFSQDISLDWSPFGLFGNKLSRNGNHVGMTGDFMKSLHLSGSEYHRLCYILEVNMVVSSQTGVPPVLIHF